MKYKHLKTTILAGSANVDLINKTSTFQANIKFEINAIDHDVPDEYKICELTFFDLMFETLDMEQVLNDANSKGIEKLKSVYGINNIE